MKRDRLRKRLGIGHEYLEPASSEVVENLATLILRSRSADGLDSYPLTSKVAPQIVDAVHKNAPDNDGSTLCNDIGDQVLAGHELRARPAPLNRIVESLREVNVVDVCIRVLHLIENRLELAAIQGRS